MVHRGRACCAKLMELLEQPGKMPVSFAAGRRIGRDPEAWMVHCLLSGYGYDGIPLGSAVSQPRELIEELAP